MTHLHPKIVEKLELPDNERISFIQQAKWIGYTQAEKILLEMEGLLDYPKCERMPGLLLIGDTNNGKTALLSKFVKSHPVNFEGREEGIDLPVVKIQAPPVPDEHRLYNNILVALNIPFRTNDKLENKYRQILHVMSYANVKILMIDEIHHVLTGNAKKQSIFLNVIKYLANDLGICIVCAGTRDARAALGSESQIVNRLEPIELPKWKIDNEYLKLLTSFEKIIPLRNPSGLHGKEISTQIMNMSEGKLGEISNIIKRAAETAIKDKTERITLSTLNSIRFLKPEQRRRG